jgi:hypothetical protein
MKRIVRILRRLFKESFSFHFLLRIGTNFKIGALVMFLCVCHLSNIQKYNQQLRLRSSFHQRYLKDWLHMGMIISRYTFSVSYWQINATFCNAFFFRKYDRRNSGCHQKGST